MKAKWKPWKPGSSKREFSWTVEFYYFIKEQLISLLGFREKTIREFINEYERLGYKAPRPIKGREKAFVFTANGLTVIVYITFDEKNWCWREKGTDQMWVIIVKGDLLKFSNPIKRTKYCHEYLIDYAAINKKRILNRPLCPKCHDDMEIKIRSHRHEVNGKICKTYSYYWGCPNKKNRHPNGRFSKSWDYGLSDKAKNFVRTKRKSRERYRRKQKMEGKPFGRARERRKLWKITRPENIKK